jgi:hypothetical protein
MSEGTSLDKKISRRDFLKMLGIGAVAASVPSILTGCEKLSKEDMALTFKEVANGSTLPLYVSGQEGAKNITINYVRPDVDRLQIRQKDGKDTTLPFNSGAETVRILGEISDPTLHKIVGKNPSLGDEITVGVYPKVTGNLISINGREDLMESDNLYALPVIVADVSYFEDKAPSEKNKSESYNKEDWRNVDEFGNGLAVGSLDSDNRFMIHGFVSDARAVELK